MTDEQKFSGYINKLIDRMSGVLGALESEDIDFIEAELSFCQSFLQNIRINAEMQDVDLSDFNEEFDTIRDLSNEIEEEVYRIKNPRWKQILRTVISTINGLLGLFGISIRIPTPTKLLTSGDYF